jgi:uncharacterized membrane protein
VNDFCNPNTVIVLHHFDAPDVHEAAEWLATLKNEDESQRWYFTGFNTRGHLALFMQGVYQKKGANKFPKWWDKFNDEVSNIFKSAGE